MKVDNVIVFPTEPGTLTGQFGPTMQGATAPVVVDLRQRDGTALDLTGFTLALYFWLASTPGTVYEATGTLAVLADMLIYTPSDDDVSVAGAFTMIIHASNGTVIHKSVPLAWTITADPAYGGGGSPHPAVFVTAEEMAWLNQLPQVQGFLMQRTVVEADESITIPVDHQMVVAGDFIVDGEMTAIGDLVIL